MSGYPFDLQDDDYLARSKSQVEISEACADASAEEKLFAQYKAMPLHKLIEKITSLNCPMMQHYFLICYRAFAKPMDVLKLLITRFEGPTEENADLNQIIAFRAKKELIQRTTLALVADMQSELTNQDFDDDEELDIVISDFMADQTIHQAPPDFLAANGAQAQRKRPSIVRDMVRKISPQATAQLNVMDVVWAITCKDYRLFANIRPAELLDLAWTGKHKMEKSPNVVAITEHFNWVTTWIILRIVLGETIEQRRDFIEFFIQVGMKFLEINNFNGVMQIVCSCNSIPISRLHKTWEAVPEATMKNFRMLENLMSYEKNSSNYRQMLKKAAGSPCLPFIGLILTDITFAVTGNPVKLGEGKNMVSVRFVETVGKVIDGMLKYQTGGYKSSEQNSLLVLDEEYGENELYELSVMREPKANADTSPASHQSPHARTRVKHKDRSRTVAINTRELAPQISNPTPQDFDYLFAEADIIPLAAGETLINEGEPDNNLYMVERGTIELYKNGDQLMMTLHTTEIFNVVSFLDNSPCWATVKAVGPSKISMIPADVARDTLRIDPALGARFYKQFAKTVAAMMRSAMILKALPPTWRPAVAPVPVPVRASEAGDGSHTLKPSRTASGSDLSLKTTKRSGSGIYGRPGSTSVKAFKCKRGVMTGTMSVSASHCYFNAKVFGLTKAISIEMKNVVQVNKKGSTLTMDFGSQKKPKEFVFHLEEDLDEVYRMLTNVQTMLTKRTVLRESSFPVPNTQQPAETDPYLMDESEWKQLLRGANCADYPKGTVFMKENKQPKEFFYIVSGNCVIQKTKDDTTTTLAVRSSNNVFGEMCFLDENQVASASVVADTEVTVYTLKSSFVNILLSHFADMAPKFYKYLALVLVGRLKE